MIRLTRSTILPAALLLAVLAALALAACAENPNEHVQSNELFRPAPAESPADEQPQTAAETAQQQSQQNQQDTEQGEPQSESTDTEQSSQSDEQPQQSSQDAPQAADADQQDEDQQDAAPLQTAEDVLRRYTNPTYGYSLELICSPFCAPTSNGVDRVSFGSETGRALIGVDVFLDDGSDSEPLVRALLALADNVEFTSVAPAVTITGAEGERFDWDEDRRATGGFQVRWHALLLRVDGLAVILRAGAVLEDYEAVAPALERAIGSFILPREISARPGRYERFDFTLEYDPADFAQEFGQPTANPPNEQAGLFVLQSTTALKAILTWQTLGEAFYDGDTAIAQSLRDSLGIENVTGFRDAAPVDARPTRTGETETPFGEGVMMIRSYAWYCNDSGREFVLHVLDPDDPEAVALPLLDGFRCSVGSETESDP